MLSTQCMYDFTLKRSYDLLRDIRPKAKKRKKKKEKQLKNNVNHHIMQCYTIYGIHYTTEVQRRELGEASQREETLAWLKWAEKKEDKAGYRVSHE